MRVTSSASSTVRRGRMEGTERASKVLPAPGGPKRSTPCPHSVQRRCTVVTDHARLAWRSLVARHLDLVWLQGPYSCATSQARPEGCVPSTAPMISQNITMESRLPRTPLVQKRTVSCHSISLMATGSAVSCICSIGCLASRAAMSANRRVLRMHCSRAAGPSSR